MYLLLLCIIISLVSCEQEVVDTSGLKYKEQLVIKAFVFAGENAKNIKITRTLPPLEKYDINKALVRDAEVYIIHNSNKYKLNYNPELQTYENFDIVFQEGEIYNFEAKWKNITAKSTTIIPKFELIEKKYYFKLISDTNRYYDNTYWQMYLSAVISRDKKFVYYFDDERLFTDRYYFSYDRLINDTVSINKLLNVEAELNIFSEDSSSATLQAKLFKYYVIAFDNSLWDYKTTSWGGSGNFNDSNVDWNISGDGIGLFIGSNKKEFNLE